MTIFTIWFQNFPNNLVILFAALLLDAAADMLVYGNAERQIPNAEWRTRAA